MGYRPYSRRTPKYAPRMTTNAPKVSDDPEFRRLQAADRERAEAAFDAMLTRLEAEEKGTGR